MKISSLKDMRFGQNKQVLKVYAGSSLVWDRNNLPPDSTFPPSAIYAWDYDSPFGPREPAVGDRTLQNAVETTTENPLSSPNCSVIPFDYDEANPPLSRVSIIGADDSAIQAFSGWFRIDELFQDQFDDNYVYLCELSINGYGFPTFSDVFEQGYGDLLFGFQKELDGPAGYKAFPTVWVRPGGEPPSGGDYRKLELTNPEGYFIGLDGGGWIPWNVSYSYGRLIFTIGDKSLENIPVIWKPKYWNFGGSPNQQSDGSYLISGGTYIDSIALHDVSNTFPRGTETCGRYVSLEDDLFLIWDFNKTGTSSVTGQSLSFESCPAGLNPITWEGDGGPSDKDGDLVSVAPILPDQIASCFLRNKKWTPDFTIAADCKGLSFNYIYNDGFGIPNPGVLLGCWVDNSDRFYLYIETEAGGGLNQSRIVATLWDSNSGEIADQWFSSYSEESVNPSIKHYARITTDTDSEWNVFVCDVQCEASVVKSFSNDKSLTFSCPDVRYQNRKFVSINKTEQRYEQNIRQITIDKVAFWVNPDVPNPSVP